MKKIESNISLKSVSKDDFKFLFELLKERDPKANISHKKMPSYATHVKFIKSKPYTKWYVILNFKQKVGSIYLSKNNEIGILRTSHIGNLFDFRRAINSNQPIVIDDFSNTINVPKQDVTHQL